YITSYHGDFAPAHSTSPSREPFKGKGVAKPSSPVSERTKKQLADERPSEIEAARLEALEGEGSEKEKAKIIEIMAQVHANACLSSELLGADVNDDNFAERMKDSERAGEALEPDTSKKQKSTEASIPSEPDVPQPPVVSSPKSSGTRRKSLGRSRITKPKSILIELDLDADDKTFIKVVSDEDSEDEAPILWFAFSGWEVISTPLGEVNALYMMDQSTKHFTTLREILRMVDRQDLLKLYGLVVKYYENHPVAGAGLIRSWRLYTLSNVYVLETISGEALYMFLDVSYPLSVKLMERMLKHKLEIDKDIVGNDMTTAEQLIRFIKNQIVDVQVSPV
ncbi:hypothetical protein Tco_0199725, partial [Tanacetum coccineum]